MNVSRVLVLSAFKWPLLTEKEAERQDLHFKLVLGFKMNTPSVTSSPILICGLYRGPRSDLLSSADSKLSDIVTLGRDSSALCQVC